MSHELRTPLNAVLGFTQRMEIDGAGIGLSVTQALVTMTGGPIEVDSRSGEGTVFTVSLVLA